MLVREKGKITNREYREITGLSDEGVRIDIKEWLKRRYSVQKKREEALIMS